MPLDFKAWLISDGSHAMPQDRQLDQWFHGAEELKKALADLRTSMSKKKPTKTKPEKEKRPEKEPDDRHKKPEKLPQKQQNHDEVETDAEINDKKPGREDKDQRPRPGLAPIPGEKWTKRKMALKQKPERV